MSKGGDPILRLRGPRTRLDLWILSVTPEDWCTISIRVGIPGLAWTAKNQCLLTGEVKALAEWLCNETRAKSISFIEPELSFSVFGDPIDRLRVYIRGRLRDPKSQAIGLDDTVYAEFPVSPMQLEAAGHNLRKMLVRAARLF